MRRRQFILALGGAAAAWPLAAIAQRSVHRVGVLANEPWPPLEGLRDGMRGLGYIEKQGVHFDYRFAEGLASRYPALAAELVRVHQQAGHMTASDLCAARPKISCQAGAIHT
jgi:putative ABC transport system substrate-binding protein